MTASALAGADVWGCTVGTDPLAEDTAGVAKRASTAAELTAASTARRRAVAELRLGSRGDMAPP